MKKAILVADSGGTRTDWCLFDHLGNKRYFETDTYHPHVIDSNWINSKKEFWKELTSVYDLYVHFYGSGCVSIVNQNIIKNAFEEWGIDRVTVESDIIGAAKASFQDNDGLIGILGTGSVLANIKSKRIDKIHGGLGYLLGDEGSGYFFGKLLVQNYLEEKLSNSVMEMIYHKLGGRDEILHSIYNNPIGKKYISNLAEIFPYNSADEINVLHDANIRLFFDKYLTNNLKGNKLFFIGSYAFFNLESINKIVEEKGWELGGILKQPIFNLAEYYSRTTS